MSYTALLTQNNKPSEIEPKQPQLGEIESTDVPGEHCPADGATACLTQPAAGGLLPPPEAPKRQGCSGG